MPLYTLKTAPKNPHAWRPAYAPNLAGPVDEFAIITREDGKRQWTYKGQALYTYVEDYAPDDLNGLLAQNDARLALAYQNFMPASVRIENVPFHGLVMVNAQGLTLYAESRSRGRRDGYGQAKAVGTKGCVDECLKEWKPLLAGPRDVASGFWDIYDRPDGSRQWAYQGSALYTYAGDKRLGDFEGDNREIIVYGDPEGKNYDLVTLAGGNRGPDFRPYAGAGFHWHIVGFYD
jgi:predicted lipoprotein with Yx(FWY)xxD motif